MTGQSILKGMMVAGLVFGLAAPALADQIDGDWCALDEAATFSISGENITTPAGTHTTGNYTRHAFSYVVPAVDPGAGTQIEMRQLNDEEILVSVGGGEPKMWRRCEVIS
jgi:hypothetical protein